MNFVRDSLTPVELFESSSSSVGREASGLTWPRGVFPEGAVACISRPAPSPVSSGRAHERRWILRFDRRSPPFVEPLMGWTGCADPLSQVELSFPSRESAVSYAERQGLTYRVESGAERRPRSRSREIEELRTELQRVLGSLVWLAWMQVRYGGCERYATPDLERALAEPAAAFGAPNDVVAHPGLSVGQKREILARWAWDEHLQQLAADDAMPERAPSRLDEVRRALCALELSDRDTALVFTSSPLRHGKG